MAAKLRPIYNRIVARRTVIDKVSGGGIILAVDEEETENQAVIISVGPDVELRVGDVILFGKKIGTNIMVDGEEVVVLREDDVFAVLL